VLFAKGGSLSFCIFIFNKTDSAMDGDNFRPLNLSIEWLEKKKS
jgi:hypothetical protein